MSLTEESGLELVEAVVKTWNVDQCWLHCIEFVDKVDSVWSYRVKWSIPTRRAPIPAATASVYFTIDESSNPTKITYVLEAQRLIQVPGQIPFREKWLKDIISTKTLIMDDVTF